MLTPAALQLLALSGAFWVALTRYRSREPEGQGRFAVGLVLGALCAHLGWALCYADRIVTAPAVLLQPAGWSVLFVPLGVLVMAPWGGAPGLRRRFFDSAAASLPLAFATARLGCLAVGCCHGPLIAAPWGERLGLDVVTRHAVVLVDIAGLLLLDRITDRVSSRSRVPVALGGFALLRLAAQPWRARPSLGEPWLDPLWMAGLWIAIAGRAWIGGDRRLEPRAENGRANGPEAFLS